MINNHRSYFWMKFSLYYTITWRLFSLVEKDIHKGTKPPCTKVLKQTQDKSMLESKALLSFLSSMVAQMAKHLPTVWETWVQSLGWEALLEKEMATHSGILAWRIPGTWEPGGLPSMGSHRVGHDWSDLAAAAATRECENSFSPTVVFL